MSKPVAHEPTDSDPKYSRNAATPIQTIINARLSRRTALLGMSAAAGLGMFGGRLFGAGTAEAAMAPALTFGELARVYDDKDHVASGYAKQVLLRWGDPIHADAPGFEPAAMT